MKLIIVRNQKGKVITVYSPNNIGATESELLRQAYDDASKVGGTVEIVER